MPKSKQLDKVTFDREYVELLKLHQYKDAERKLLQLHQRAQNEHDADLLEFSSAHLAMFYALPATENFDRASFYFSEREKLFPSNDSRLQTALFRFNCLKDAAAALEKLDQIVDHGDDPPEKDAGTLFSATALKGQCFFGLGEIEKARQTLARLSHLARKYPGSVVRGDALNLIEELVTSSALGDECRKLLDVLLQSPMSEEIKERAVALRESC
jgi:tetratricopeptide (TPR) repeat protein